MTDKDKDTIRKIIINYDSQIQETIQDIARYEQYKLEYKRELKRLREERAVLDNLLNEDMMQ